MKRLALFLIARATPAHDREWVVGDTLEELDHVARTRGTLACHLWMMCEVCRVLLHAPRHRRATRARQHGQPPHTRTAPLRGLRDDVRFAVRRLWQSPAFTTVAALVLGLAVGAGTAVFSVVDTILLRGLPFDEYDRIVAVRQYDTTKPKTFGDGRATSQTYLDWRAMQESFDTLSMTARWTYWTTEDGGAPSPVRALRTTWELFPTLRTPPLLGRTFTAADEAAGARLAVIGYGLWQRRFGGSSDVLGRTMQLGDQAWEIVGVMPPGFSYPVGDEHAAEMYVPYVFDENERTRGGNRNYNFDVIGRLKPGVSIARASDQMNRLAAALDEAHPEWGPGMRVRVVPLHDHLVGDARSWLVMLLGAVGLVLLIACANVANLLLARAAVRRREIAVRAAIGASGWRLTRAFLVEGLVLSVLGAALGVALAHLAVRLFVSWLPSDLPRIAAVAVDMRVLAIAVGVTLLTGITFSVAPALHAWRPNLSLAMQESGRAATAGASGRRVLAGFVVAEVALATVLLVGAGLFVGSFVKLLLVDLGFDYRNVLAMNVVVPAATGSEEDVRLRKQQFLGELLTSVGELPGVEGAAAVSGGLPLSGSWSRTSVRLPNDREFRDDHSIDARTVSPDYLQLLRVPLLRGRHLTDRDRDGTELVVVINQAAARLYWPDDEALGQRVVINDEERVVVGVVGDIRHLGPEQPTRQEGYLPLFQSQPYSAMLVVRTHGDPLEKLPAVKNAIWRMDPTQRLMHDTPTIEAHMNRLIAQRRLSMVLLTLFGGVGLLIAAIGLYGVMSYAVAQRTREIGLRMALGAAPRSIVTMVLGRAGALVAAGLLIGVAGAWFSSAAVEAFLFEIPAHDIRVFGLALAVLALTGVVAAALPARRAAAVDPLVALRID